jgi:hypothetical protein
MANTSRESVQVDLEITPGGGQAQGNTITIKGCPADLHQNPQKIHQLLDLLNMPQGTEVKITTVGSSVIVR